MSTLTRKKNLQPDNLETKRMFLVSLMTVDSGNREKMQQLNFFKILLNILKPIYRWNSSLFAASKISHFTVAYKRRI